MKPLICGVFLMLFASSFSSQKEPVQIYLGCYKTGDTLTMETLLKIKNLSLLTEKGEGTTGYWVKTWEMVVYRGSKASVMPPIKNSPTIIGSYFQKDSESISKLMIQAVTVSVNSAEKTTELKLAPATFYISPKAHKLCK